MSGVTRCHRVSCPGEERAKKTSLTGRKPCSVPAVMDAGISVGQRVVYRSASLSFGRERTARSRGRQLRKGLCLGLKVLITRSFQAKVLPSHPDPRGCQLAFAAIMSLLLAAPKALKTLSYRSSTLSSYPKVVVVYLASSELLASTCSLKNWTEQQNPAISARRCITQRFNLYVERVCCFHMIRSLCFC
jgi:hypothetical protein